MAKKNSTPTEKELQRTKKDLEDLEMYIQQFSSFLPLAVCTVNPLKIIIDVNRAFQNLTNYSSMEIVGEPLKKVFLEKKEIDNLLEEAQKTETIKEKNLTLVSKDKKQTPVSISLSIRKDEAGNFIGYFISITDISEFKKLEKEMEKRVEERTKELKESRSALMNMLEDVDESRKALTNMLEDVEEARRRAEEERNKTLAIITNFVDGLLTFDVKGKLTLINPQAEQLLDVKKEEVVGKTILELSSFPAIEPIASYLGREIKGVFRKEIPIKQDLTLEISTVPIMSDEEKLGTLVILHDITREKMIERMKTEFVSIAAHQLRTPLSAIKWTLRMLLDGDLGEITPEQREFVEKTYRSNERMINLINDLLNVTRIEEGRYLYKPVPTDIVPLVKSVVDAYKEEAKKKKLKLEFKKPAKKLPKIIIDAEKITLAIQNLIDNAIRYTPPQGKVAVSLRPGKKEIEFLVKDTGVGIPGEQQDRIFTKFFRGANAIRMETEGSGLGLFITKNIIEAHGGKIWFESKENQGTTFYFTLPIKEEFAEFLKEF